MRNAIIYALMAVTGLLSVICWQQTESAFESADREVERFEMLSAIALALDK